MKPAGTVQKPPSRLDGAPAQEDLPFVLWDAADDEAGILVMDRPAGIADVSR
jgi:hypothetical protein